MAKGHAAPRSRRCKCREQWSKSDPNGAACPVANAACAVANTTPAAAAASAHNDVRVGATTSRNASSARYARASMGPVLLILQQRIR